MIVSKIVERNRYLLIYTVVVCIVALVLQVIAWSELITRLGGS